MVPDHSPIQRLSLSRDCTSPRCSLDTRVLDAPSDDGANGSATEGDPARVKQRRTSVDEDASRERTCRGLPAIPPPPTGWRLGTTGVASWGGSKFLPNRALQLRWLQAASAGGWFDLEPPDAGVCVQPGVDLLFQLCRSLGQRSGMPRRSRQACRCCSEPCPASSGRCVGSGREPPQPRARAWSGMRSKGKDHLALPAHPRVPHRLKPLGAGVRGSRDTRRHAAP
jgi:hypothetical protein